MPWPQPFDPGAAGACGRGEPLGGRASLEPPEKLDLLWALRLSAASPDCLVHGRARVDEERGEKRAGSSHPCPAVDQHGFGAVQMGLNELKEDRKIVRLRGFKVRHRKVQVVQTVFDKVTLDVLPNPGQGHDGLDLLVDQPVNFLSASWQA